MASNILTLKKGDPHARAPAARQQRNNKVWLVEGGGGGLCRRIAILGGAS